MRAYPRYLPRYLISDMKNPHLIRSRYPIFRTLDQGYGTSNILGIEVAHQKHSVLLFQRKYALNLLEEAELLGCKPATTPMEANINLWFNDSHTLDDPRKYKRLIGSADISHGY